MRKKLRKRQERGVPGWKVERVSHQVLKGIPFISRQRLEIYSVGK